MGKLEQRVAALEARREIERLRMSLASAFDSFDPSTDLERIVGAVTSDCRISSTEGLELNNRAELGRFLSAYRPKLSFVMTLLTGGVRDLDMSAGTAEGEWVMWQPFSTAGEAWMLAGRTHDTFQLDGEQWRLSRSRVSVEIRVPWSQSWVNTRVVPLGTGLLTRAEAAP